MEIYENIRRLRKERKMTQQELASAIGKGTSTIQKYELGITCPPIDVIRKICTALNCDFHDIVQGARPSSPSTPSSRASIEQRAGLAPGTLDKMSAERNIELLAEWSEAAKKALNVPSAELPEKIKFLNSLISIVGFRVDFDGNIFYFVRGGTSLAVREHDLDNLLASIENDIARRSFDLLAETLRPTPEEAKSDTVVITSPKHSSESADNGCCATSPNRAKNDT